MKSTYLNDAYSSTYPFAASESLPFPMHCIAGGGFCISPKDPDVAECPELLITSLEFTADDISAYLCIDSVPIGSMTFNLTRIASQRLENDDWIVSGWLQPGVIRPEDRGSYPGPLRLDARCVTFMPKSVYGKYTSMIVAATRYDMPTKLSLSVDGLLNASFDAGTREYRIAGVVSDTDKLCLNTSVTEYDKVASINGIAVRETSDMRNWLTIKLASKHQADLIFAYTANVPTPADPSDTTYQLYWQFEKFGEVDTINLAGTEGFPSCYINDHDAGTDVNDKY